VRDSTLVWLAGNGTFVPACGFRVYFVGAAGWRCRNWRVVALSIVCHCDVVASSGQLVGADVAL